jgi:hypothetical protein
MEKSFGEVRMKFMYAIMFLFLLVPVSAGDNIAYSIHLVYENETFSLENLILIASNPMPEEKNFTYTATVQSFAGESLYETTFDTQTIFLYTEAEEDEEPYISLTSQTIDLILPWYANAEKILILEDDITHLEINVSGDSICNENAICDDNETYIACPEECLCGDGVCDEDYLTCPDDCSSGGEDGVCDTLVDDVCDPDCFESEDYDCQEETGNRVDYSVLLFALVVALVIGLGLWYLNRLHKKSRT